MDKIYSVLIVGVGGQGTILASNILTQAAINAGLDSKKSEIHGMSQRGGSVFSHVRFGKKVHSPVIPLNQADILVSLEEMETARWLDYVNGESNLIILNHRILPANVSVYPEGIIDEIKTKYKNVTIIDQESMLEKIGNSKYLNVFLLGVVSKFLAIPETAWQAAIKDLVPAGTFEKNYEAFTAGKNLE